MTQSQDRNARCHCGSGKKFKNCHGAIADASPRRKISVGYVVAGIVVLAALYMVYMNTTGGTQQPGQAPPGKVWSAEHGHWHDAP